MEINYSQLKKTIDAASIEEMSEIEFNGLVSILLYDDKNTGCIAEYHAFPEHYEIYLWECVPIIFRKPMILHEVAELTLNELYPNQLMLNRHGHARKLDVKYAQERMKENEFQLYLKFIREHEESIKNIN